jgi:cullin 3
MGCGVCGDVVVQTECGYQFTSKLEGMFNDMRTSKEALAQFSDYLAKKAIKVPVELSIQILTTGFWPMQPVPQCNLPKEVQTTADVFKTHYMSSHNGRRLSWQTSMVSLCSPPACRLSRLLFTSTDSQTHTLSLSLDLI